jgi:hypothetical protein
VCVCVCVRARAHARDVWHVWQVAQVVLEGQLRSRGIWMWWCSNLTDGSE